MERQYIYSIIIPHYNSPTQLTRLLKSIPNNNNIQIIVVDDCSEIKIKPIIDQFQKSIEIEYYNTIINGGGGKARNIGLKKVRGEYIIFADADDYFSKDAFEIWNKIRGKYPDSDLIFTPILSEKTKSKEELKIKNAYNRYHQRDTIFKEWLITNYTQPWGKLVKSSFIKENQIEFQETKVANDCMFSIISGNLAKKAMFVNTPFYVYTKQKGTTSDNPLSSPEKVLSRLTVYYNVEHYCINNSIIFYPFSLFITFLMFTSKNNRDLIKKFCIDNKINQISTLLRALVFRIKYKIHVLKTFR